MLSDGSCAGDGIVMKDGDRCEEEVICRTSEADGVETAVKAKVIHCASISAHLISSKSSVPLSSLAPSSKEITTHHRNPSRHNQPN